MTASSGAVKQATQLSRLHEHRPANENGKALLTRRAVVVTPDQAAELVQSGDTILINGSGGGVGTPERFLEALAERYRQSGRPRAITAVHPIGCGDWGEKGMSRLALPGLLKRQVTGSLGNSPATMAMAANEEIEAYTLPQGVLSQLCREIAAGRPGLVTHVGVGSFVDPRHGGGRQTARASDDMVELITLHGREFLFYPAFPVDVAIIRATTADEAGNLTMEREPHASGFRRFISALYPGAEVFRGCLVSSAPVERCGSFWTANSIEARQALEIGLVNEVVQNSPIEAAIARAKEWTSRASVAAQSGKASFKLAARRWLQRSRSPLRSVGRSLQPPICARAWRRSCRREAHASRGIER